MASEYGGLDIRYTYTPSATAAVDLITDTTGSRAEVSEVPSVIKVTIKSKIVSSLHYAWVILYLNGVVRDESTSWLTVSTLISVIPPVEVRIFFYNNHLSISFDKRCVYTYAFGVVQYNTPVEAALKNVSGASLTLTNIRRREIYDGRGAIFVDYEADGTSVISSLIQQRPVQVYPDTLRRMNFTYLQSESEIDAVYVSSYDSESNDGTMYASDGLVYFRDVAVSISEETARIEGFVTKLFKLSELDTGAVEAAAAMQRISVQRNNMISIQMRFDPRIEYNDQVNIDLIEVGTDRHIEKSFIVEDITIAFQNGSYSMRVSGRKKDV